MGDFNARVGNTPRKEDSVWHGVHGYHGVGEMNESGKNLLSFSTRGNILERNISIVLITLLCGKVTGHCVKM